MWLIFLVTRMVPTSFVNPRPLEVPFLVPPKLPILGVFGNLGGTKNGTSSGPQSTKLVGTIRVTNKMSHIDNGPSPGRNYGETAILHILHILALFLECKTPFFSNCSSNINLLSIQADHRVDIIDHWSIIDHLV